MNARRLVASVLAAALVASVPAQADTNKQLRMVRGVVGHQTDKNGTDFKRVTGTLVLPDNDFAVTQANANGLVVLPDSSEVALGPATTVRVGAFNDPTSATPTQITLASGTMRFSVKRPAGGKSNYQFATNTSQVAVRGTIGLFSTGPNGDTISCLACDPGDVVVTVGPKTYPLLTGQTLFVSLAGAVTAGAITAALLQTFASAGLSTSAATTTAFAPGVASGAGTGVGASTGAVAGANGAASGIVAGGFAAAAVGTSIVASNSNSPPKAPATTSAPMASPTPSPTPSPSPSPTPSVSPSPVTGTGQIKSLAPPTATPTSTPRPSKKP